jgi:hypothetical protein
MINVTPPAGRTLSFRVGTILAIFLFTTVAGTAAGGQSGRRLPTWNEPKPQPSPEQPAQPAKQNEKKPPKPLILVSYQANINTSSYLTNTVMRSCLERLKQTSAFDLSRERDMNRKEASDLAKTQAEAYVVLVQLQEGTLGSPGIGPVNYRDLEVEYVIFAPGTGKVKTSGRVFQRPARNTVEYRLEVAGLETADRICSSLGVAPPGTRLPYFRFR